VQVVGRLFVKSRFKK